MERPIAPAFIAMLFVAMTSMLPTAASATEVTMDDFVDLPPLDCVSYCLTGACVWLVCNGPVCYLKTSPLVSHRNPDLVVSVYQEPGENPWEEIRMAFGPMQKTALAAQMNLFGIGVDAGHGDQSNLKHTRPLLYREADAFGHPVKLKDWLPQAGLVTCPSQAEPLVPYFQSAYDGYNWRLGLAEYIYLDKAFPGVSEVGQIFTNAWGSVYLRTGFIPQYDYAKANAVIAQRVGDIVTRTGQPHTYVPLDGTPSQAHHYELLPPPLTQNTAAGGVWRMLAPKKDDSCTVFGTDNPPTHVWSTGRQSEDRASVFSLWRPYECCRRRGAFVEAIKLLEPQCT